MRQIYYTYILKCNNGIKYYGHTNSLSNRLKEHQKGKIHSTKNKQPELVYYEEFDSRSDAFKREMQLKNGRTRKSSIEKLIAKFPNAKCQGFNSRNNLRSLRFASCALIEGGRKEGVEKIKIPVK